MLSRMRIGGEHDAELGGHLAADQRDAARAGRRPALVDERDQPVADLELERVERQQRRRRSRARRGRRLPRRLGAAALLRRASSRCCRLHGDADADEEQAADEEERQLRQARDEAMQHEHAAGDVERARLARASWPAMSLPRFDVASPRG